MEINVAMELAKNEIVENINQVSSKYNLPSCLLNVILQAIALEVNNIAKKDLEKNMQEYMLEKDRETKEKEESDK